jgi:hypothetical protein
MFKVQKFNVADAGVGDTLAIFSGSILPSSSVNNLNT